MKYIPVIVALSLAIVYVVIAVPPSGLSMLACVGLGLALLYVGSRAAEGGASPSSEEETGMVEGEASLRRADAGQDAPAQRTDGVDPAAVAAVESLMREARELPIGAVRGHAVAHFKVDLRGGYWVNGKRSSLEELRGECARLARIGGVVIYYRENPTQEAPPGAQAVIEAVCRAGLPLTFAARDYDPEVKVADYLLPAGAW
jgi:hypothetical protein